MIRYYGPQWLIFLTCSASRWLLNLKHYEGSHITNWTSTWVSYRNSALALDALFNSVSGTTDLPSWIKLRSTYPHNWSPILLVSAFVSELVGEMLLNWKYGKESFSLFLDWDQEQIFYGRPDSLEKSINRTMALHLGLFIHSELRMLFMRLSPSDAHLHSKISQLFLILFLTSTSRIVNISEFVVLESLLIPY